MATEERTFPGKGLLKGLAVTMKHMLRPSVTQQYPHEKPELPPRTRGVIALKEANCTVCYKCSRACPDWCIFIDAHKETHDPAGGGKARSTKVLDRFAIDYSLCMYCGICVEVCPFDALFWSPEYEYAEYDVHDLLHEKERLEEWTYAVPPPLMQEVGAQAASVPKPAAAPAPAQPVEPAAVAEPAAPVEAQPAATAASAAPAAKPAAPRVEVEPDQEVYDRVLAEELAKGTAERVAQGKAKRAAMLAAKRAASPAEAQPAAPAAPAPPAEPEAPAAKAAPAAKPAAPRVEVEPDQEVYDRVLAEELAKGTAERVAQGKAKRAAMLAARKKAQG